MCLLWYMVPVFRARLRSDFVRATRPELGTRQKPRFNAAPWLTLKNANSSNA